jgi:acetyl esterase/lipase
MSEGMGAAYPPPEGTTIERVTVGNVTGEWATPPGDDRGRVVLYLHGGGYVMCSAASHRGLAARIAAAMGGRSLAIDYRLAPEHPFPAALDDAMTAYRWLLDEGTDPSRIVVAGDSAGGGLAVATALRARDEGLALPGALVCLSPWVDLECASGSMATNLDDPLISAAGLRQRAEVYVPGGDLHDPLAAPIHADLGGLPPMLIQVGTGEALLDDAKGLAARAEAAGVEVVLDARDEVIHVWQLFAPAVPEALDAIADNGRFLDARLR